jgi:hypothetical protein
MAKQPDKSRSAANPKAPKDAAPSKDTPDVRPNDRDKDASVVGEGSGAPAEAAGPASKHGRAGLPLFAIAMITALASSLGVAVWAKSLIEKRIAAIAQTGGSQPATVSAAGDADRVTKIDSQILALQNQLDTWRREQLLSQKDLRESIERVAGAAHGTPQQTLVPLDSSLSASTGERTAEMTVNVTPTQKEFIMLKERNRLTAYADEVIATGSRKPLETIVEYLRDPSASDLHDAAQAEYLRAVRAIQTMQREDPGYRLPVTDLFKEEGIRNEADLKPEKLFRSPQ